MACHVCRSGGTGHFHVRVGDTLPAQFTYCPNDPRGFEMPRTNSNVDPSNLLTTLARWWEAPCAGVITGRLPNGWHVTLGDTDDSRPSHEKLWDLKVYAPGAYDSGDDPVTVVDYTDNVGAADIIGDTLNRHPDPEHIEPEEDVQSAAAKIYRAHPAGD